jgi:hypothetical protein
MANVPMTGVLAGSERHGFPMEPTDDGLTWEGLNDSGWDIGLVVQVILDAEDLGKQEFQEFEDDGGVDEDMHQDVVGCFEQETMSLQHNSTGLDSLTESQINVTNPRALMQDFDGLTEMQNQPEICQPQDMECARQAAASPERCVGNLLDRLYPQVRGSFGVTEDEAFLLGKGSRVPHVSPLCGTRRVMPSPVRPSPRAQRPPGLRRVGAPEPVSPRKSPRRPIMKALAEPVLSGPGTNSKRMSWPLKAADLPPPVVEATTEVRSGSKDADADAPVQTENPSTWALSRTPVNKPMSKAETWSPTFKEVADSESVSASPTAGMGNKAFRKEVTDSEIPRPASPTTGRTFRPQLSEPPASKPGTSRPQQSESAQTSFEPRELHQEFGSDNNLPEALATLP